MIEPGQLLFVLTVLIALPVAGDRVVGWCLRGKLVPLAHWIGACAGAWVAWFLLTIIDPASALDPYYSVRLLLVAVAVGGVVEVPLLIRRHVKAGVPLLRTTWEVCLVGVIAVVAGYYSLTLPHRREGFSTDFQPVIENKEP